MAQDTTPISIGPYRNIRLWLNDRGVYEIRWSRERVAGGKRSYASERESCRTKERPEAQAYFLNFCQDLRAKQATPAVSSQTVGMLIDRWLDFAERQHKHESLKYTLASIRAGLGSYTPAQLAANGGMLVEDYLIGRRVSDSTKRREWGALLTVLYWGAKRGFISRSDIPVVELPPVGAARQAYLNRHDEQRFWDLAMAYPDIEHRTVADRRGAKHLKIFVALAMTTAARREAICDLTWDRVYLDRGQLDYKKPGKPETKKRRVNGMPIAKRLRPILEEAWLEAEKDSSGRAIGRVVGIDARSVSGVFTTFTRTIGFEWVTPHVLRHTWASLAAMNNVSMQAIAKILGDSVVTVEKHYAHLAPEYMHDTVNHAWVEAAE